jgi:NAD(P)H-nitrite reductase large subunit
LKEYAKEKSKAVVIGGGVLGLQVAGALLSLGLKVTVLEFFTRLMSRQLDVSTSQFLDKIIANSGVKVVTGASVQSIKGDKGCAKSVVTADSEYEADVVLIASGVRANIQLASDAGIKVNRGIIVNEKMETSHKAIYAAGDVAEFDQVCMQLWAPALEQGKVAGANAVGDQLKFKNQIEPLKMIAFGSELFAAGNPPDPSLKGLKVVTNKDEKILQFSTLIFQDDKLIYGAVFNMTNKFPPILNAVRGSYSYSMVMAKFLE